MRLYPLPLGELCCDKGKVLSPGAGDGVRTHIPIVGYLVVTKAGRRIVVDTGMHRSHVDDPDATWRGTDTVTELTPVMRVQDTVDYRLAELGLRGADVTDVINTHFHFDHAGNNDAFPNATFHVQRSHYQAATDNPSFPNQYWRLPGLDYSLLEGEADLGDGLLVFPTPGHAPGHQSVALRLDSGQNMILCGDAIYEEDNLRYDTWGGHADPPQARQSAMALLERARDLNAMVLYGHDAGQWQTVRKSPNWYE
ncbi:MAG TPA: N-acyl homoserine lactonase family protein [Candidatus Nanopelagicaceae bacterium]|nr:N-acyl homoserine lactonase family protein [Candidatus Nanopelagicaceae bacterium]